MSYSEKREVLNYITTYTYHVLEKETGHNATLSIKHLIRHFQKYPNILSIVRELRANKLITGYEWSVGDKKGRVRVTTAGTAGMPITFERRDIKRYIHWDNGSPYLEDDAHMAGLIKEVGC